MCVAARTLGYGGMGPIHDEPVPGNEPDDEDGDGDEVEE